jgi:hypothetical protein
MNMEISRFNRSTIQGEITQMVSPFAVFSAIRSMLTAASHPMSNAK